MDEILKEAGEGVADLMKVFTEEFIKVLINGKLEGAMDEAVETVMPSGLTGGDDEDGGDDVVEVKADDEKEQGAPIAAGVQLRGYRLGTGPDYQAHRFYEFACFAIKEQDSVVTRCVKKHSQVTSWQKSFTKSCADVPKDAVWPKKKMMGKNDEYYRQRYTAMDTYFKTITDVDKVSLNPDFLTYWNLQYDPDQADRMEQFMSAIEGVCDAKNVNFQRAQRNAERLGFDLDECEMLKVVAVESVGRDCIRKLRVQVNSSMSVAPAQVRGKFVAKAEQKLAGVISAAVQAGWDAAKEAFKKVIETVNGVLEKGMDPIREIFNKVLEPVGNVIKEKFAAAQEKVESKMEVDDGLDRKLNIGRFPPLKACLAAIESGGKAVDELEKLIETTSGMEEAYKFAGYLMYNLGDPEIGQYIPFIDEIQDNHYRLAVAMTDLAFLISRAGERAFRALAKHMDFVADSGFDSKEFDAQVVKALREAGRSLASDYFDVPSQVRRMTWRLPNTVTNRLLLVGQTTICEIANLLGQLQKNWKPTSKDDVKSTFVKAVSEPLDKLIEDRCKLWVTVIRRGTESVISDQFMGTIGDMIDKIAEPLNDLCSALPDPLGSNLKPGDIVSYLLNKMCENAIVKVVEKIACKTEAILYNIEAFAEPADENLVRRVRYRPYVRPDNYDPTAPAEEGDDDDEDEKKDKKDDNKDAKKDEDGAAPGINKQLTNDNTPDSDPEDGAGGPESPKAATTE